MIISETQTTQKTSSTKTRTLNECFVFLDNLRSVAYEQSAIDRVKALCTGLGHPEKKLDIILVGGSNNKNTTILLSSKLLIEEENRVGTIYSNHILTYHERIFINNEAVSNKALNDFLNLAIDVALKNNILATAFEILLTAGLAMFADAGINVAIIETGIGGRLDATAALDAIICGITKVTPKDTDLLGQNLDNAAYEIMAVAKPGCWVSSAEQSKLRLQKMKKFSEDNKMQWSMPIRKLSSLPYIYEQLYGKEASLAERIVQIYVENVKGKFSPFLRGNLLATQKGQRGRPTLEAKRNSEINPLKTIKMFWADNFELRRGVFEILEKEKPTILLDEATDEDGLGNLFLGLRLLHYKNPISSVSLIIGLPEEVDPETFLKLSRYLFKKVPGEMFLVPLTKQPAHNLEKIHSLAKIINVKTTITKNIEEAFAEAKKITNDRTGIVCISGNELIGNYWKQVREVKKL